MRRTGAQIAMAATALFAVAACVVTDPDVEQVGEAVVPAPLDDALDSTTSLATTRSGAARATTHAATPPQTPTQAEALLSDLRARSEGTTRVGLVAHRASTSPEGRTIDLIAADPELELSVIFAPEHGLAGTEDAGASVSDGVEPITGAPVVSLYGRRLSPTPPQLADLDVLVYDLQDVGVRTFTYIATLGLVLEAAAAAGLPVVVLDRLNPQGTIVDGPVRVPDLESFISPYPIPTVYGLTSGQLARMMVGEGWIEADEAPTVIGPPAPLAQPWIPPSPNLPTLESAWLYPAVVAFEATSLSVGRGTDEPFTVIGGTAIASDALVTDMENRQLLGLDITAASFTPEPIEGMSTNPRYAGQPLSGIGLSTGEPLSAPIRVTVELLDAFMDAAPTRAEVIDRPDVFDQLVGSPKVREALLADQDPAQVAESWSVEVVAFTEDSAAYR